LDFHKELAKERQLKNGERSTTFLVPLGTALILQLSSSPITSTVCPLAAALAAGNPAIVLGSPTLSSTNELVEQIILTTLDCEAFHFEIFADAPICKAYMQEHYEIAVINSLEASQAFGPLLRTANPSIQLIEPYYGIPAGFIDRSGGKFIDAIVKQIQKGVPGISSYKLPGGRSY
jgi:acyl-CoA reductase-like NAD-dependent aldehyde dehydrogenase